MEMKNMAKRVWMALTGVAVFTGAGVVFGRAVLVGLLVGCVIPIGVLAAVRVANRGWEGTMRVVFGDSQHPHVRGVFQRFIMGSLAVMLIVAGFNGDPTAFVGIAIMVGLSVSVVGVVVLLSDIDGEQRRGDIEY